MVVGSLKFVERICQKPGVRGICSDCLIDVLYNTTLDCRLPTIVRICILTKAYFIHNVVAKSYAMTLLAIYS